MRDTGIRLQRIALRRRFFEAYDDEIARRLRACRARSDFRSRASREIVHA